MCNVTKLITNAGTVAAVFLLMLFLVNKESHSADPNQFNRLLAPPSKRNPPPPLDGIHDAGGPGAALLQTPKSAFDTLPRSKSGNYVDWVQALEEKKIEPRYDRNDV